jgi:hypothetical protein
MRIMRRLLARATAGIVSEPSVRSRLTIAARIAASNSKLKAERESDELPSRIFDLSSPLENETVYDPPFMRPKFFRSSLPPSTQTSSYRSGDGLPKGGAACQLRLERRIDHALNATKGRERINFDFTYPLGLKRSPPTSV